MVRAADHLPATPIRARCVPGPLMLALGIAAALGAVAVLRGRARIAAALLLIMLPWFVPLVRPRAGRLSLLVNSCVGRSSSGGRKK